MGFTKSDKLTQLTISNSSYIWLCLTVSLSKHIPGLFTKVIILWWNRHFLQRSWIKKVKLLKIHVVVHIALKNDKTLQHCMRREQVELLILFVISTKISGSLCPYGVFPSKLVTKIPIKLN